MHISVLLQFQYVLFSLQVRSFSQLKHELKKCETFYLDTEEPYNNSNINNSIITQDENDDFFSMDLIESENKLVTEASLIHGGGSLPNLPGKL